MNSAQLEAYLQRAGLDSEPSHDIAGIEMLQRAVLETTPFENLDILDGKVPLDLSETALFDKIVNRQRGGICYELNYLYQAALETMGFTTHLLGGRIYDNGDEFDHVFLLVDDPQEPGARWMTDVGFAYNVAAPLKFECAIIQDDGRCQYRIDCVDDPAHPGEASYDLIRIVDGEESRMFTFRDIYRDKAEFESRCHFFESDPSSRFLKGPLVCIDGEEGRITLSMRRLKETRGSRVTERDIDYPGEFDTLCSTIFNMKM